MTKTTVDQVVDVLVRAGFAQDGHTRQEHVRIPTTASPVFGGIGGERRTLGGRQRWVQSSTNLRATVGPRTVYVYTVVDGDTTTVAYLKTRDIKLDELLVLVATRKCSRCAEDQLHTSGYDVCDRCATIMLKA